MRALSAIEPVIALYSHGPTDPSLETLEHERFHVELPGVWFNFLKEEINLRNFVTLGSVQESDPQIFVKNNYLQAKNRWLEIHRGLGEQSLHFQLHTVYGNPLRKASFLGQITQSLLDGAPFAMSDGTQLREYQNVEVIADTISRLILGKESPRAENTFVLSHGDLLSLREIAEYVFSHFGRIADLKVGSLPKPSWDLCTPAPPSDLPVIELPKRLVLEEIVALIAAELAHSGKMRD